MRSLIPLIVGILLGMGWIVFWYQTPMFASDVDEYGIETTGLCLGGPAFMIMMAGIFISMLLEDRK